MSETSWGEEAEAPPKKKGLPTWLWFCGGGCAVSIVLAIILGAWLFSKAKEFVAEATDPEKQWPKLAQILPFDERPADVKLEWGSAVPFDLFVLKDAHDAQWLVWRFQESQEVEVRTKMLSADYKGGVFGRGGRKDLQAGKIRVQGRDLEVVRFHQLEREHTGADASIAPESGQGPSILVDLTPEGSKRLIVLQAIGAKDDDAITDERVQAFLKPFHVGSER